MFLVVGATFDLLKLDCLMKGDSPPIFFSLRRFMLVVDGFREFESSVTSKITSLSMTWLSYWKSMLMELAFFTKL